LSVNDIEHHNELCDQQLASLDRMNSVLWEMLAEVRDNERNGKAQMLIPCEAVRGLLEAFHTNNKTLRGYIERDKRTGPTSTTS
jgi:hypothetical protein